MNIMKKIMKPLLIIVGCISLFPMISLASEEVEVILHNVVYMDPENPLKLEKNSGLELTGDEWVEGIQTKRLNGATIEVFAANDYLKAKQAQGLTLNEIVVLLQNSSNQELKKELANSVASKKTSYDGLLKEAGIARFKLTEKDNSGKYQAYIFLQTFSNEKESNVTLLEAAPMLLSLPVSAPGDSTQMLATIHLYPKIVGISEPEKPEEPGHPVPPKPSVPTTVPPKKTGILPQTGEAKTLMSIVGFLVLSICLLLWRRHKQTRVD